MYTIRLIFHGLVLLAQPENASIPTHALLVDPPVCIVLGNETCRENLITPHDATLTFPASAWRPGPGQREFEIDPSGLTGSLRLENEHLTFAVQTTGDPLSAEPEITAEQPANTSYREERKSVSWITHLLDIARAAIADDPDDDADDERRSRVRLDPDLFDAEYSGAKLQARVVLPGRGEIRTHLLWGERFLGEENDSHLRLYRFPPSVTAKRAVARSFVVELEAKGPLVIESRSLNGGTIPEPATLTLESEEGSVLDLVFAVEPNEQKALKNVVYGSKHFRAFYNLLEDYRLLDALPDPERALLGQPDDEGACSPAWGG